jgi:hypothetical protein
MKHVHKQYEPAFLLEPTKLGRIVDTIHQRLADHANTATHDVFEVFLTGNHREEMTAIDDVLALDNSRRHRVARLVIQCSASTPGSLRPEHEVQVDFGAPAAPKPGSTSGTSRVVTIDVRSDAPGWANRTLSEVEEQVERTWPRRSAVIVLLLLLLIGILVLAAEFLTFRAGTRPELMWLNDADLKHVEALLEPGHTLSEQEVREVATMQLRNVLDAQRPPPPRRPSDLRRSLFIAAPLLVVLLCVLVLLTTCYPNAVFLWGDEVGRFDSILQRRKVLWGLIIAVTVGGVLSKFLYEGVSFWLPR